MGKIKPTHLEHLLPYHAKYQEGVQILITVQIIETHLFSYKATNLKKKKKKKKKNLFYGRTDLPSRIGGSVGRVFLFCFSLFLFFDYFFYFWYQKWP